MTTYKIVVVDLRAYRVERVDSGGFKSVRSFATYEEAQLCVDQDRIFETKAVQAKRAELRRLAAALTVRATAARKKLRDRLPRCKHLRRSDLRKLLGDHHGIPWQPPPLAPGSITGASQPRPLSDCR
jgi:hypothetical protein